MTKRLTIKEAEYLAHSLAKYQMSWDEPIPDFGTRYPGKLEGTLSAVYQTYGKKDLYPTFTDKASNLFYLIIKNHPFLNGNKRIAVTSLLTFMYLNKKWIDVENEVLYEMAVWVAKSNPQVKNGVVLAIKEFISKNQTAL